jgi:hypothetical protein
VFVALSIVQKAGFFRQQALSRSHSKVDVPSIVSSASQSLSCNNSQVIAMNAHPAK